MITVVYRIGNSGNCNGDADNNDDTGDGEDDFDNGHDSVGDGDNVNDNNSSNNSMVMMMMSRLKIVGEPINSASYAIAVAKVTATFLSEKKKQKKNIVATCRSFPLRR
jgi:hypothetical protein